MLTQRVCLIWVLESDYQLIMEHLEDDNVHDIMQGTDKASDHSHSKSAYEMLEQFHVGSLPR